LPDWQTAEGKSSSSGADMLEAVRMAEPQKSGRLVAWMIHLFTATSAVLALLALAAVVDGEWRKAFLWLLVALAIDGVDGTLARKADVTRRLPQIDGSALDLVVDYLTYVFVPAWLLWRIGAFPSAVALPLVAAILLSSLYTFARRDMKTEDGYFRGFPALWNVVALYVYAAAPGPWLAAGIASLLITLTFAPIHTVHPMRVRDYGAALPVITLIWSLATLALLMPIGQQAYAASLVISLGAAAILIALGLTRTLRGARKTQ
jgi:phosphatidylcholine synthase